MSGEHVTTFPELRYGGSITSLAFSPDGKRLAAYDAGGTVRLWDVASKEHVATIDAHEGGSFYADMAFSPDGRLLATGSGVETKWFDVDGLEGGTRQGENYGGNAVKLWEVATGKPIAILPPWSSIYDLAFSPAGKRLVEMTGGVVRLWNISEWDAVFRAGDHRHRGGDRGGGCHRRRAGDAPCLD